MENGVPHGESLRRNRVGHLMRILSTAIPGHQNRVMTKRGEISLRFRHGKPQ